MFPDDWLHIKKWEKFQYRSDKNLPWIRLECALLQNKEFLKFDRATQRDLIAIWLLARNQSHPGWIPNDSKMVSKLIQGGRNLDLQVFVNTGFLEKKCASDDMTGQDKTIQTPLPPLPRRPKTPAIPVITKPFIKPVENDVRQYMTELGMAQPDKVSVAFIDHYQSNGWMVGKTHMKDWKAAVRTWKHNNYGRNGGNSIAKTRQQRSEEAIDRAMASFDSKPLGS